MLRISLLILLICPHVFGELTLKNVIERDDRVPVLSSEMPWSAIGKLAIPGGGQCTAVLVYEDIVLTNRHCILDSFSFVIEGIRFWPNFKKGSGEKSSGIYWATWGDYNNPGGDWALLRLNRPLGRKFGYLSVADLDFKTVIQFSLTMVSYSGDFLNGQTAGMHRNCHIRASEPPLSRWIHDCDGTRGSSGSPIFIDRGGIPEIVALNFAESRLGQSSQIGAAWSIESHNFALQAKEFIPTLTDLIKTGAHQAPLLRRLIP